MPAKKIDGESRISVITKRASNCSTLLRRKAGQCSAPGMMDFRALIIWQPLQTPRAKVSLRLKKAANSSRHAVVHQDGPRPAEAGAEHVTIGKAATGDQTLEILETDAAGQNVAHMHVDRGKAGLVEGGGHFVMAVDALLAQDGNARTTADLRVNLSEILLRIEGQLRRQAGIGDVEDAVEFLLGAARVVAHGLHLVAGLGPGTLQVNALFTQHALGVAGDADFVPFVHGAHEVVRHTAGTQNRRDLFTVGTTDLDQGTEFFVEQGAHDVFEIAAGQQVRTLLGAIDRVSPAPAS